MSVYTYFHFFSKLKKIIVTKLLIVECLKWTVKIKWNTMEQNGIIRFYLRSEQF